MVLFRMCASMLPLPSSLHVAKHQYRLAGATVHRITTAKQEDQLDVLRNCHLGQTAVLMDVTALYASANPSLVQQMLQQVRWVHCGICTRALHHQPMSLMYAGR